VTRAGSASALLVIDMQREALEGCPGAAGVIDRINDLARRARESGAPVIFIQHEGDDELTGGTPGWEIDPSLERDGAHLVPKAYRDAFAGTELEDLLERLGVRRLIVTGVHSDFCVQMTTLSAVVRGYDVVLVSDAHTTIDDAGGAPLAAREMTRLVNSRIATLRHPGSTIEVLPAGSVEL
jgi:nicotinamidase-related amidase